MSLPTIGNENRCDSYTWNLLLSLLVSSSMYYPTTRPPSKYLCSSSRCHGLGPPMWVEGNVVLFGAEKPGLFGTICCSWLQLSNECLKGFWTLGLFHCPDVFCVLSACCFCPGEAVLVTLHHPKSFSHCIFTLLSRFSGICSGYLSFIHFVTSSKRIL